jgi:hypothetical protein
LQGARRAHGIEARVKTIRGSMSYARQCHRGGFTRIATSAVLIAVLLIAGDVRQAEAVQTKPATDWSFYVQSIRLDDAYTLGCNQGRHDYAHSKNSEVILDFGGQNSSATGTKLVPPANVYVSNSQIQEYTQEFARGWWECNPSYSLILELGIGTNNSFYSVSFDGGKAWAQVVQNVRNYVASRGWHNQVKVGGANDMEPDWASAPATKGWVSGYASLTGTGTPWLINFGSADGCPQTSWSNGYCNNGWRQYDLWYVSWGATPAYALPQIYYSSMAKQWSMIGRYGSVYQGRRIYFEGPLDNNWIAPGTNTSEAAWTQLWTEINRYPETASNLKYSAQMHYSR